MTFLPGRFGCDAGGKKAAGRLLDAVEHNGFPKIATAEEAASTQKESSL
jgi:hypothetical protein